jgi:membrane protein CcdC involved in cytochrome C biogenesis
MQNTFIIFLVALLLFRRLKNSVGFQKFSLPALVGKVTIFILISAFYIIAAQRNSQVLNILAGVFSGLVLAYVATYHARFEKRENGLFYRTHVWVEIIVVCLFLFRFVYRLVILKDIIQPGNDMQDASAKMKAMQDPVTGILLLCFCTYYIGYYTFILMEGRRAIKNPE